MDYLLITSNKGKIHHYGKFGQTDHAFEKYISDYIRTSNYKGDKNLLCMRYPDKEFSKALRDQPDDILGYLKAEGIPPIGRLFLRDIYSWLQSGETFSFDPETIKGSKRCMEYYNHTAVRTNKEIRIFTNNREGKNALGRYLSTIADNYFKPEFDLDHLELFLVAHICPEMKSYLNTDWPNLGNDNYNSFDPEDLYLSIKANAVEGYTLDGSLSNFRKLVNVPKEHNVTANALKGVNIELSAETYDLANLLAIKKHGLNKNAMIEWPQIYK